MKVDFPKYLYYNPVAGTFTWKTRPCWMFKSPGYADYWNRMWAGKRAGKVENNGYVRISLYGRKYQAHQVAAIMMGESFEGKEIDHINGDRADNRWANLRVVTKEENMRNQRIPRNNTSGVTGVSWSSKDKKWDVRLMRDGRSIFIGRFEDWFDAVCARKSANNRYDFHPGHGKGPTGGVYAR